MEGINIITFILLLSYTKDIQEILHEIVVQVLEIVIQVLEI